MNLLLLITLSFYQPDSIPCRITLIRGKDTIVQYSTYQGCCINIDTVFKKQSTLIKIDKTRKKKINYPTNQLKDGQ